MKFKIKHGFAAILFLSSVISCTKESVQRSSSVTTQSLTIADFVIGQQYGGGIIFYIDSTGQHGLIGATQDQSDNATWSKGTDVITGATGTAIGTGRSNTNKIVTTQGKPGDYAAIVCHDYRGAGYTDWYLPSKDELGKLYNKRDVVGGFAPEAYWSSSERNLKNAWCHFFDDNGSKTKLAKSTSHNARAIRAF